VLEDCKPTERPRLTQWFSPEVHVLANTLVPIMSTNTFSSMANWYSHKLIPHVGIQEPTASMVAQWHAQWHAVLVLLFTAPSGWARHPSQSFLRSTAQSSLRASIKTTTKPSKRWQPPRVISTPGLQLDHLVPLDATSWCNALESHSLVIALHSCEHSY
jgi:hypothetical protein